MFKKEKLENIKLKNFEKNVSIKNNKIKFKLNGIKTGTLSGKEIVADEVVLNNIMEKISEVLYKNETNYINIPSEVNINFRKNEINTQDKQNNEEKVENKKYYRYCRASLYTRFSIYKPRS